MVFQLNLKYLRCFFFQAVDGIRDLERSRGLGEVYKRQSFSRPKSPDSKRKESGNPREDRRRRIFSDPDARRPINPARTCLTAESVQRAFQNKRFWVSLSFTINQKLSFLRDYYTCPVLLDFRHLLHSANWSDFSPCFTLRAAFAALFLPPPASVKLWVLTLL